MSPPYSIQVFRTGQYENFKFLDIQFLLRKFTSSYAKSGEEVIPMQERTQKILLLSASAVRSRICTSGKSQEEIAERCLCSDRQVRNWTSRDTDISVSRLYALQTVWAVTQRTCRSRFQFPRTGNRPGLRGRLLPGKGTGDFLQWSARPSPFASS